MKAGFITDNYVKGTESKNDAYICIISGYCIVLCEFVLQVSQNLDTHINK